MQVFATVCVISLVWVVIGYSLAFTDGTQWVGDFGRVMLSGPHRRQPRRSTCRLSSAGSPWFSAIIPESVFMMFQMTFAAITPALIVGAFVDRMKFAPMLVFMVLWSILVYAPIAHWVWSPNGFLFSDGVLDFAGGTVVHINAGIAGLVCCLVLGKRLGFGNEPMAPHNLTLTPHRRVAAVGRLVRLQRRFAGRSRRACGHGHGGDPHRRRRPQRVAWMLVEWIAKGKPSVLGIASGAVAGLVAITPASGYVLPSGALVIGLAAGIVCYWGATGLKHMLGYDDSLDVFGVHGVGGILGALLTGVFATSEVGGDAVQRSARRQSRPDLDPAQGHPLDHRLVCHRQLRDPEAARPRHGPAGRSATCEREGLDLALHGESVA